MVIDKFGDESMYVGTKTGVYYKNASMADWIAFDGDLPIVDVREMEIYYGGTESRLRIGTYGRGLWETDLYYGDDLAPVANFEANKTTCVVGEDIQLEDLSAFGPTSWTWTISPASYSFVNGTNANSRNPELAFSAPGVYTISLLASNVNGNDSKTINSYIQVISEISPSCTPSTANLDSYGMGIYYVALNTIDQTSGQPYLDNPTSGYMNYILSSNTTLQTGTQYTLQVILGSGYTEYWNVYIDYNNDGDFLDVNELIYASPSKVSGQQSINFTTIANPPMNTLIRMRILCDYFSISGPCDNPDYGQAEDYGIIFKDLPELTTTTVSNIIYDQADSGGNITDQGSSPVIARGLVWDIRTGATLENNWGYTENGSGSGSYNTTIPGLFANTTYYVRAYAINNDGIAYGNEEVFTTLEQFPDVSTSTPFQVLYTTAGSGGNITDDKGKTIRERGVIWNTTGEPSLSSCIGKTLDGSGSGVFVSNITGLNTNTQYFIKAYARNSYGIGYGDEKTFTTLPVDVNQSSNIIFSEVSTNKIKLEWTNGTGASRIVKINNVNTFTLPVNGTDPSANTLYAGGEQVIYNGSGNTVTVTNLNPATTYYFHVFDYNGSGASTEYNIAPGNGNPASRATYCLPTYTNGDVGTHIKRFIINKINNISGSSHYTDYTNLSTALLAGEIYDVSVEMSYNAQRVSLWIDFNNNGLFETSEKLITDLNCPSSQTTTTQITIPTNVDPGSHVLRVRAAWSSGYDACAVGNWGEAEDYMVEIKDFFTWDGANSNNWNTGSNWDVGKVPGTGDIVEIENVVNKPVILVGQTVNVKKVTCLNGSEIEVNGTLNVDE